MNWKIVFVFLFALSSLLPQFYRSLCFGELAWARGKYCSNEINRSFHDRIDFYCRIFNLWHIFSIDCQSPSPPWGANVNIQIFFFFFSIWSRSRKILRTSRTSQTSRTLRTLRTLRTSRTMPSNGVLKKWTWSQRDMICCLVLACFWSRRRRRFFCVFPVTETVIFVNRTIDTDGKPRTSSN